MPTFPLLSLLIFLPLAAGAFLFLVGDDESPAFARGAALTAAVLNALLSLMLLTGGAFAERASWIPTLGIGYDLRVDGLSLFLMLLVTMLTPLAIAASWKLIQTRARVYYGCMLLLSGGMLGVLAAMDGFLFYVFWELMLIPAFFLVGLFGGERRREATTKFVVYTMVGSLLMLVGLVYLGYRHFVATGAWSFALADLYNLSLPLGEARWAFLAFALAFAIKAALFPLHTWLPDTYGEAPAPVTFMLSAVMAKLGIYGFLRLAMPLFPEAARFFGPLLIALAVIGVVYAALIALVQEDAKRVIAYASVSHLGIILLAIFTTSPEALHGAVLHMVAHALTTGALFLLVGLLAERRGSTLIKDFGGVAGTLPLYASIFMLVTLASVGLPGLTGFVGEFLIFLGAFRDHPAAAAVATTSVILGAAYMLWMFQRVMFGPLTRPENGRLGDLSLREGLFLAPIVVAIVALGVYPQPVLARISPAVSDYLRLVGAPAAQGAPATPVTAAHPAPGGSH